MSLGCLERPTHSIGSFEVYGKGLNSNSRHTTWTDVLLEMGMLNEALLSTHVIPFTAHRMFTSHFTSPNVGI